jgi:hypothetical protein
LFAAAGKFDEALAAYREANKFWQEALGANSQEGEIRVFLANLYLRLADLYADCPAGSTAIKAKKPEQLREARVWYQKSVSLFTEIQSNSFLIPDDKENSRLASEKLRLIEKN